MSTFITSFRLWNNRCKYTTRKQKFKNYFVPKHKLQTLWNISVIIIQFNLRFGVANSINTHLWLKIPWIQQPKSEFEIYLKAKNSLNTTRISSFKYVSIVFLKKNQMLKCILLRDNISYVIFNENDYLY